MKIIATVRNSFEEKFGVPRQSGIIDSMESRIVFEPEFRNDEMLRGLTDFDYIWLIWLFSENGDVWHPTVRPPRLGGNRRIGVFATRSPFRPNPIGLSSVKLMRIENDAQNGPVLIVNGADLMNGTPIIDIKPYLPYTDSHENARAGFADRINKCDLKVVFPESCKKGIDAEDIVIIEKMLSNDPRPPYQEDERVYGMLYGDFDVHFTVQDDTVHIIDVLRVK